MLENKDFQEKICDAYPDLQLPYIASDAAPVKSVSGGNVY